MTALPEVIARMEEIEAGLPPRDGVRAFNELYLAVTRAVVAEFGDHDFEDPSFLARLDGVFADLYFRAFAAAGGWEEAPHAWEPLFDVRAEPQIAPIQFALAGMNAHINYDLSVALVETCEEFGVTPRRDSPQFRDFTYVNEILERVEATIKDRFATGLIGVADEALGRLDDVVAMWKVARARDAAWTHAETLWALRHVSALKKAYLLVLGRIVGFAGRGLLIRVL
jgi:hypothetical protein